MDSTVVTSEDVAVAGAPWHFDHVILQDGEPMSLAGKTVKATIRPAWLGEAVSGDFEEIAATVDDAPGGGVDYTVAAAITALAIPYCPTNRTDTSPFDLQYRVDPDGYQPQVFRFHVRSGG